MKLLLATTSPFKAREIAELLRDVPDLELKTLNDYPATEAPEEDADSMEGNAQIKAEFYSRHFQTRVLADDSGLEVDALNGEPGIHSARWFDGEYEERNGALLARLTDVPVEHRSARYRCALCLATPDTIEWAGEGVCEGEIALEPRGSGGFGYDPIFGLTLATGVESGFVGQTMGQVAPDVKASVSHRARAVRLLAEHLKAR
jgi:XTP/dITP diphosphohydrolase